MQKYDQRLYTRKLILRFLLFIFFWTLIGFLLIGETATAEGECLYYAVRVVKERGVNNGHSSICAPDGLCASVGHETNSVLTLDMGNNNYISDGPGADIYYYEKPEESGELGILLDRMVISVAQEGGNDRPGDFLEVFVWGDNNVVNNGSIPKNYLPEVPNKPISINDLYEGTGIAINIGFDDGKEYRYVRFQTYPQDGNLGKGLLLEVDAIERIHSVSMPTSTTEPISTPTFTIELTNTDVFPPSPTAIVETPGPTNTLIPTDAATITKSPTVRYAESYTPTISLHSTSDVGHTPTDSYQETPVPTTHEPLVLFTLPPYVPTPTNTERPNRNSEKTIPKGLDHDPPPVPSITPTGTTPINPSWFVRLERWINENRNDILVESFSSAVERIIGMAMGVFATLLTLFFPKAREEFLRRLRAGIGIDEEDGLLPRGRTFTGKESTFVQKRKAKKNKLKKASTKKKRSRKKPRGKGKKEVKTAKDTDKKQSDKNNPQVETKQ